MKLLLILVMFVHGILGIPVQAENVTDVTAITIPGFELDEASNTYKQEIVLKNIGEYPLGVPLSLIVKLNFKKAKLANASSVVGEGVYAVPIILDEKELAVGEKVRVALELQGQVYPGVKASFLVDGHWPDKAGLPKDPGGAADATPLGVDSNNNGVRDDIERYIHYTFTDSEKTRLALSDLAKS